MLAVGWRGWVERERKLSAGMGDPTPITSAEILGPNSASEG
jgi:hypothetical protein